MQQTRHVGYILLLSFTALALASCGQPKQSNTAIIRIVNSSSLNKVQGKASKDKVGTLGLTIPVGKYPCFGISITAADIPGEPTRTCSPATGVVRGFVKSGQPMEAEINYGSNRSLQVYMMLKNDDASPCPAMPAVFPTNKLSSVYLIGTNPSFNIDAPEVDVPVELEYTDGTTLPLASSFPLSCTNVAVSGSNPHQFFAGSAGGLSTDGSNYQLKARVGRVGSGPILSGGSYKMRVK